MKKKLLTILVVVVLVLSIMSLAFVGCKKKDDGSNQGGNGGQTVDPGNQGGTNPDPQGGESKDDPEKLAQAAEQLDYLTSYAQAWVVNNAGESVAPASALQNALKNVKGSANWKAINTIKVALNGNEYSIDVTFAKGYGDKQSVKVNAVTVAADRFVAGIPYAVSTDIAKFDDVFVPIANGLLKTIKTAIDNGVEFITDEKGNKVFSANAELGVSALVGHFGDVFGGMESPAEFSLRIGGNIGREAKDTQAAIEIFHGDKALVGLYYFGAEDKEDCKLYLGLDIRGYQQHYFIDNAELNALVMGLLAGIGSEEVIEEVEDAPAEEEETPIWEKKFTSFEEFLGLFNLDPTVGGVVKSVITKLLAGNMGSYPTANGGKMYQIRIDLKQLISTLLETGELVQGIVNNLVQSVDMLKTLDVATMQGIGGALILSAEVKADETLGSVELSYNVDEHDFRFNANDTEAKKYGPINLALFVRDFDLGKQNIEIGMFEEADYTYFSPLNIEASAEFSTTISGVNEDMDGTVNYVAELKTNINPFAMEDGVFQLTLADADKTETVFNLYGDLFFGENGLDASIELFHKGEMASFNASDVGFPLMMTVMGIVMSPDSVLAPVVTYVTDLMKQFGFDMDQPAIDDGEDAPADEIDEQEDEGLGLDMMGLINVISHLGDELAKLREGGSIDYPDNIDFANLGDFYFRANLDNEVYNEVVKYLSEGIGALKDVEFDQNAAHVDVFVNYTKDGADYGDRIFVHVKYKAIDVTVDVNWQHWELDKLAFVKVTVTNGEGSDASVTVYDAKIDAANWDKEDGEDSNTAKVTYSVTENFDEPVTYVDATVGKVFGTSGDMIGVWVDAHLYTATGEPDPEDPEAEFELMVDHNFYVNVSAEDGNYRFTGVANDHEINIDFGEWKYESRSTLSFGIPAPRCSFNCAYDLDGRSIRLVVRRAEISNWGASVTIDDKTPEGGTEIDAENVTMWVIGMINDAIEPFLNVNFGNVPGDAND